MAMSPSEKLKAINGTPWADWPQEIREEISQIHVAAFCEVMDVLSEYSGIKSDEEPGEDEALDYLQEVALWCLSSNVTAWTLTGPGKPTSLSSKVTHSRKPSATKSKYT
jgi:hypothetical protein